MDELRIHVPGGVQEQRGHADEYNSGTQAAKHGYRIPVTADQALRYQRDAETSVPRRAQADDFLARRRRDRGLPPRPAPSRSFTFDWRPASVNS
jgi:hypothetical protein